MIKSTDSTTHHNTNSHIFARSADCTEYGKTSNGLTKSKVVHLKNLRTATKKSKTTTMANGLKRRATGTEKIQAFDNISVLKELGIKKEPEPLVEPVKVASKFAQRLLQVKKTNENDETKSLLSKIAAMGGHKPKKKTLNIAQVAIAAIAKKKQTTTLKDVLEEARKTPQDLLQYDLIEIKPSQAASSAANHFMRMGYKQQLNKKYAAARSYFSRAIIAERFNTGAWFCRGVANDKCGDYFRALSDFGFCLKSSFDQIARVASAAAMNGKRDGPKGAQSKKEFENINDLDDLEKIGLPFNNKKNTRFREGGFENIEKQHKVTISRIFFNRGV